MSGSGLLEVTELTVDLDDEPICSACKRVAAWGCTCPGCKVSFLACHEHRVATDQQHASYWLLIGTGLTCRFCNAPYPRDINWRQL